jgi:uncharacterized protein YbaP (TraB family)
MPNKYYATTEKLGSNVASNLYDDALVLAKRLNLNTEYLSSCRPWWATFELMNRVLSDRGYKSTNGVDHQALGISKAKDKANFFLEPIDASLKPFALAPHTEQEAALAYCVQRTDDGIEVVDSIIKAWESGDPTNLEPIYQRSIQQFPETYSAALDGRNKQWIRHLLRFAASGRRVVAVVGVLHFAGPNGLPKLLAKANRPCSLIPVND